MADTNADPVTLSRCRQCDGVIGWIDCPTGGWWAHEVHPADEHDASPNYAETVSANIHKATPAKVFADDAESTCIHCHKGIRQVPGGHGPTWVHSDSGAVVGSGVQIDRLEAVMLIGARQARRDGGAYWLGYLQALSDSTGCAPSTLTAWLDSAAE